MITEPVRQTRIAATQARIARLQARLDKPANTRPEYVARARQKAAAARARAATWDRLANAAEQGPDVSVIKAELALEKHRLDFLQRQPSRGSVVAEAVDITEAAPVPAFAW